VARIVLPPYHPNAFILDGVADYFYKDSSVVTAAPVTFSAWFWASTTYPSNSTLVAQNTSTLQAGFGTFGLNLITSGRVEFRTGSSGASSAALSINGVYPTQLWTHAAGVSASATSRFAYRNGIAGTENVTSRVPAAIDRTAIGANRDSTPSDFFPGAIAHAAIWNVALTSGEIRQLANGVSPWFVRREGLVAYWPLVQSGLPPGHDVSLTYPLTHSTQNYNVVAGPFANPRVLWNLQTAADALLGQACL